MPRTWSYRRETDYESPALREKVGQRQATVFSVMLVIVTVFFFSLIVGITVWALVHPPAVSHLPTGQNP